MAKNPWLLYGGRGKVGNIVLQRNKGVTTMREKVDPTNVRSMSQQKQRSKFGYLAKFYSKGVKNLFKFAFESKRSNESDYNAFMRNNVQNSLFASKEMLMDPLNPWFGQWLMSEGSLESLDRSVKLNGGIASVLLDASAVSSTVSAVSTAILSQFPTLANGDILTFVSIADSNEDATTIHGLSDAMTASSLVVGASGTIWNIKQFKINTSDPSALSAVGFTLVSSVFAPLVPEFADTSNDICGCCVIASRNTDSGVRVSTSHLVLSAALKTSIKNIGQNPEWADFCARSMGGNEEGLLKGALLAPANAKTLNTDPAVFVKYTNESSSPFFMYSKNLNVADIEVLIDGSPATVKKASIREESSYPTGYEWYAEFNDPKSPSAMTPPYVLIPCFADGRVPESTQGFIASTESAGLDYQMTLEIRLK